MGCICLLPGVEHTCRCSGGFWPAKALEPPRNTPPKTLLSPERPRGAIHSPAVPVLGSCLSEVFSLPSAYWRAQMSGMEFTSRIRGEKVYPFLLSKCRTIPSRTPLLAPLLTVFLTIFRPLHVSYSDTGLHSWYNHIFYLLHFIKPPTALVDTLEIKGRGAHL